MNVARRYGLLSWTSFSSCGVDGQTDYRISFVSLADIWRTNEQKSFQNKSTRGVGEGKETLYITMCYDIQCLGTQLVKETEL